MTEYTLYYATNRNHIGDDQWHPDSYGTKFSDDGMENLRFGIVTVSVDDNEVAKYLNANMKDCGRGDGESFGNYLSECAEHAQIDAYEETLKPHIADVAQKRAKLGSQAMFTDVMSDMENSSDVLIYIHGFNVSWFDAVGSALALQLMLQNARSRDPEQNVLVILFTWPSDGMALPWVSYKSDRSEATGSGAAVGRAFLKARDFLADLRDRAKRGGGSCAVRTFICSAIPWAIFCCRARSHEHPTTHRAIACRVFLSMFSCVRRMSTTPHWSKASPWRKSTRSHAMSRFITIAMTRRW